MFANDFAIRDDMLRVHMIAHGEEPPKSDAFLLAYNGQYLLIDGGMVNCPASLAYIMEIRRDLLSGHEELLADTDCRLKISIMISHCHRDHVGALITHVLPSPYLEVESIYLPAYSALPERYGITGTNGDTKYRPLLCEAWETYQPNIKVSTHDFGVENRFSFRMIEGDETSPLLTICPPCHDYGEQPRLDHLVNIYCEGNHDDPRVATLVINNTSDWLHVRHGHHSFLFTGDTTKKLETPTLEMAQEMTDAYLPILGHIDVLKYVHHGYARNAAAVDMMRFTPAYVIISAKIGTGGEVIRRLYPDDPVKLINCGTLTYIFETDGETLSIVAKD